LTNRVFGSRATLVRPHTTDIEASIEQKPRPLSNRSRAHPGCEFRTRFGPL